MFDKETKNPHGYHLKTIDGVQYGAHTIGGKQQYRMLGAVARVAGGPLAALAAFLQQLDASAMEKVRLIAQDPGAEDTDKLSAVLMVLGAVDPDRLETLLSSLGTAFDEEYDHMQTLFSKVVVFEDGNPKTLERVFDSHFDQHSLRALLLLWWTFTLNFAPFLPSILKESVNRQSKKEPSPEDSKS